VPKPGLSKCPSLVTSSIFPQRENGKNIVYFEPAGNRNYITVTQAWIEEKQFYHGQALTAKPRYEAEEDQQKQWGHYTAIIWPEVARVGMGFFDVPDNSEWPSPSRTYVVARYDVMQILG
jgi:Cysteine-rich secretory protein family